MTRVMKNIRLAIPFFVLFAAAFTNAFGQQDSVPLTTILTKTARLTEERPLEKVYLHFDKPYYAVEDTIWFKAYVTGIENQPTALSKILYVEMISGKDSLVRMLKLPLVNGVAPGHIALPELTYRQGNYRVRAYTKWMANFDEAYFFHKAIPVGSALNKDLITHMSFIKPAGSNTSGSTVRIQFKDGEGKPYGDRKVSWSVNYRYDELDKGKTTTDINGFVTIALKDKDQNLSQGALVTELRLDNVKALSSAFPLAAAFNKTDIQFFPEGGDLIAGVPATVAFKAVGPDGLGRYVKGEVVDPNGKPVANFASQHLGMGTFNLIAEAGKTYKATITFPDGSKMNYPLPEVKPAGIALSANGTDPENIRIRITASDPFFQKNRNKGFYLVGQSGNVVYYAAQTALNSSVFTAAIPKSKFPPGIVQLTLFNSTGAPLSERLVFIQPANTTSMVISTDKKVYAPKQKVQLSIIAKDGTLPVEGNYSVSVTDETKVPFSEHAETTILSSLLLTSDLKGFVEQPNYYFAGTDPKRLADLDVLMLTQGYRRFAYQDILNDKYPPITYLPEQSIEVAGTLRNHTGMPLNKTSMRIAIPDRSFSAYATTNPDGRFKFSNLLLADSSKVVLEAGVRNVMLMVDGNYFPAIAKNVNRPQEILNIDSALSRYLENSKRQYRNAHLLREVVITSKAAAGPSHADHPALSGLGVPDHVVAGDRFKDCPYLLNCMKTALMGMTFDNEQFYVTKDYNAGMRVPAQIYLNGMAVDVNALVSLSSAQVESVEIFFKDALGLVNKATGTNGVLVVNTRKQPVGTAISKQQLMDLLPKSNVVSLSGIGYSKIREFYSPRYDVPAGIVRNDLRTTVYWNPAVITGKDGKATFNYFNADGLGTYRVTVEGIDSNGNVSRSVYRYTVK